MRASLRRARAKAHPWCAIIFKLNVGRLEWFLISDQPRKIRGAVSLWNGGGYG
jgi:hypothetical protein